VIISVACAGYTVAEVADMLSLVILDALDASIPGSS